MLKFPQIFKHPKSRQINLIYHKIKHAFPYLIFFNDLKPNFTSMKNQSSFVIDLVSLKITRCKKCIIQALSSQQKDMKLFLNSLIYFLVRFATNKYNLNLDELDNNRIHVTNYAINKVIFYPTTLHESYSLIQNVRPFEKVFGKREFIGCYYRQTAEMFVGGFVCQ